MSYLFYDADSSILSADSSVISGSILRPVVQIGSVLSAVPVNISGTPSISGAVTIVGTVPVVTSSVLAVVKAIPVGATEFRFNTSVVSTSVTLIAASVASQRAYITDISGANTGSSNTLLTFTDGSTSVVAYVTAPAGGGAIPTNWKVEPRTAVAQDLAFKAVTATSILYLTVNGYQL